MPAVGLKVPLRVAHCNQIVVDGVNEEPWNGSLRRGLSWVKRVKVKTARRLAYLGADLRPHHLHDCLGWHSWHHLGDHSGSHFLENTEGAVDDET